MCEFQVPPTVIGNTCSCVNSDSVCHTYIDVDADTCSALMTTIPKEMIWAGVLCCVSLYFYISVFLINMVDVVLSTHVEDIGQKRNLSLNTLGSIVLLISSLCMYAHRKGVFHTPEVS